MSGLLLCGLLAAPPIPSAFSARASCGGETSGTLTHTRGLLWTYTCASGRRADVGDTTSRAADYTQSRREKGCSSAFPLEARKALVALPEGCRSATPRPPPPGPERGQGGTRHTHARGSVRLPCPAGLGRHKSTDPSAGGRVFTTSHAPAGQSSGRRGPSAGPRARWGGGSAWWAEALCGVRAVGVGCACRLTERVFLRERTVMAVGAGSSLTKEKKKN